MLASCNLSDNRHDQPSGLMVEMLRQPELTVIEDSEPEFSWVVNGNRNDDRQIAYQIFVSTTQNKAELDQGDCWDTGKILSPQSVNISYQGEPLKPNTRYFWKVRVWYQDKSVSSYSDIQSFKTGNLNDNYKTSVLPLQQTVVLPVRFSKKGRGGYFADFGKDAFGTIRVQIKNPKVDSVIFHLGEKLAAPDSIDRNPCGTIRYRRIALPVKRGNRWYTLTIPTIGQHQHPASVRMPLSVGEVTPFRYCEIENFYGELLPQSVEQLAVNYYWDDSQSSFSSSDSILNAVWDISKYSIKATSFAGIYVDGDRERIPYEADAYINQLGHYCTDREYTLARYSHEYLITHPTWPTEWIMHTVLMAWADYLYTGDRESLRFFYDDLREKTLLRLAREDGLISTQTGLMNDSVLAKIFIAEPLRDIVDWPAGERDGNEMPKVSTVVNAFHYQSLKLMSQIAAALGYQADNEFFSRRANQVRESINRNLFNPLTGLYIDGEGSSHSSLHANIFPLAFGIAQPQMHRPIAEFIVSKKMACSVYAAQYLLEALYVAEEDEAALNLLRSTSERSWWNMIQTGSTITLEAWDIKYKPNLDWNHAWGAVPANIIPRGIWGIEPLLPGFEKVQIKPQTGGLESAQISFPTIRGTIEASFVTDNHASFLIEVLIPANVTAVVYVPLRTIQHPKLLIGEQNIDIKPGNGFYKVELGSGKYRLEVTNSEL